jgi:hypothetical protein
MTRDDDKPVTQLGHVQELELYFPQRPVVASLCREALMWTKSVAVTTWGTSIDWAGKGSEGREKRRGWSDKCSQTGRIC